VSYAWSKLTGPTSGTIANASASSSNVTGLVQGTYVFRLTVTDDDGARDYADVSVAVIGTTTKTNVAPVAKAGNDRAIYLPDNNVILSASGSFDSDGSITSYAWSKINGPASGVISSPSAYSTTVTNLVQGTYTFRLTVRDNDGATGYEDVLVAVYGSTSTSNLAPIARVGFTSTTIALPTNSVYVNGIGSSDSDGSIVAYNWSKISGPASAYIAAPNAAYTIINSLVAGTYVFRFSIRDNDGAISYKDVSVVVKSSTTSQANNRIDVAESISQPTVVVEKLSVYPNPASNNLNLQISSEHTGKSTMLVYDVSGKLVRKVSFEKAYGNIQQQLNISDLKKGLYHVEISIDNKTRMVSKFVKQ
jgi:hypothetical protein